MPLSEKARAGARRFAEDMQECVRLGLVVGYPGRLTPGETRITRARKELAHMKELDTLLAPAGMPTHADKFRDIHGKSLDYFDQVLSAELPFDADSADLAKLHNIKLAAASKTIQIGARVAIELYRGQNVNALARLLERMGEGQTIDAERAEPESPALVGFD